MVFLINILVLIFSSINENPVASDKNTLIRPDFSSIEIIADQRYEEITDNLNFVAFSNQSENNIFNPFIINLGKKLQYQNIYFNFIYRLLPYLIDVPPPANFQ